MSGWNTEISSATVVAFPKALALVGSFVGALIVAGLLLWGFWLGRRWMVREPPVPKPQEHGSLPEEGPVHEVSERREFDEMPQYEEQERLTPHEMPGFGNMPSKRSSDQERKKWSPGSTGSFGSGGPGATR